MALRTQERERGLATLNEARHTRRRAIVFGRVRMREAATGFWVMSAVGLTLFSFAYYRYSLVELEARRNEVLGKQRAVAAAIGTRGFELRDRIEAWVIALAGGKYAEVVSPGVGLSELENGPSIYLRLRQSEAHSVESIRKAAKGSSRDGFTSCMFVGSAPDWEHRKACSFTDQCGPGEVCNDWNVCAAPMHPYNMHLLYEGLRVLTPEWKLALADATNDKLVRAIELDLESLGKHEAVAAVELVKHSQYFTAVLDGEPAPGSAPGALSAEGESPNESLQAVDHPVRVGIWDLEQAAPLAVLELEAAGRFVRLGSSGTSDPRALRAQQRQANNCAAASRVREVLTTGLPKKDPALTGAPAASD